MIQAYLMGGLGNQMHIYATAKALQRRLNTDLELNVSYCERDPLRKYELGAFGIREPLVREMRGVEIKECGHIPYMEIFGAEAIIKSGHDFTLVGYWQTEKYFADIRDELLQIFQAPCVRNLKPFRRTAIHIRRGDTVPPNGVMAVIGPEYYAKAIDALDSNTNEVDIFSDDPEWCKANCQWGRVMEMHGAVDDLLWMSRYEKIVIANSSYSFWAAWLSGHDNVIAPANWFTKESGLDARDIVPERWKKI
jgi:glycosyl transferase family 11